MTQLPTFEPFGKIPRFNRDIVVTEKIDGTNACVYVAEDGSVHAGSRTRWITPEDDNFGFAAWVRDNADDLRNLGPGRHFGEWWGKGIQRGYGLDERRFSLFNVTRWENNHPACCHVVPWAYRGEFDVDNLVLCQRLLQVQGSLAAPGYMKPEGIVIYHTAANALFKVTFDNDGVPKSKVDEKTIFVPQQRSLLVPA